MNPCCPLRATSAASASDSMRSTPISAAVSASSASRRVRPAPASSTPALTDSEASASSSGSTLVPSSGSVSGRAMH
ncbi:MAG: hypothetical protein AMS20_02475 [Gemmatimonas sp. SG8_28]|nr:MAG: hypothetical protein AMS20_02475 [Gemmatimonas sp. SG8_28]